MPLPTNPQRVALATDAQGRPVFITREWLRAFDGAADPSSSDSAAPSVTPEQFAALQAQVTLLAARVTVLEREVESLLLGYQA